MGAPSFSASVGVSVMRGRLPGATTLNGLSAGSVTKASMRWLSPTPVPPATTAGCHPPLGVTLTTHPSASAASTDVVPARKASSNDSSADCCEERGRCAVAGHASSCLTNGFVSR
jgi:hypothetical protein